MELQVLQEAMRLVRRESLVERTGRVRRQVVHHDPDPLGLRKSASTSSRMHWAKSHAVRLSLTLTLRQGRCASRKDEQVDRAVAAVLAVVAFALAGFGRDRLPHLADQLGRALVEADHRPLRKHGRYTAEVAATRRWIREATYMLCELKKPT